MRLKRFLILAPVVLILGLLQSYFWVPTYETQTTGNPERVSKFIETSIGDAKILNPILNADSASSRIAGLVFEGLLDLDEDLNLRGRLATDWTITETAYLLVNEQARFPDGVRVTPELLQGRLRSAVGSGRPEGLRELVADIRLLAPERQTKTVSVTAEDEKPVSITVQVDVPMRLQFSLRRVDQDFFERLKPVIGHQYDEGLPRDNWIKVPSFEHRRLVAARYDELLPVFEHNPVIVFKLRKGVYFHDGHEFDAGDVKFTYQAIMNPENLSPRTPDFEPVKEVQVIDAHTVRVVYKRLFSPAINAWAMGVVPEHLLNADALRREMDERGLSPAARAAFGMRDSKFNRNPIGVGPFRFVQWQSDEMIHLTRNDGYWEGPPQYRDYYYRVIPDALTQEVEFRTGAIDAYAPEPHQVARYKRDQAYQAFSNPAFSYVYIGYNNRHPLFTDKRVRRALGMAIDTDQIIKYVIYGQGERTTGPYPKNTEWYDHNVESIPYDPDGALRILQGLGWRRNADGWLEKDGKLFEFNLITNHGNLVRKQIMTIAQNDWRKIGIKCNTQLFEWAVFLEDFVNPGKFDALILGWGMGVDPDLYQIWHSSQSHPYELNFVGYRNPKADALILQIRREYNHDRQREMAHRLHRLIAEDQPYTFLYAPLSTLVLDKKIVMVEDDGSYTRLKPTRSGNLYFYFNRWKKLVFTPEF